MAGCGWFPSSLLLVYLLELYRQRHILYILYFIYIYIYIYIYICLMFGFIQSSGTNLYLPCYLQQSSHDSESITPLQQQGALSHINNGMFTSFHSKGTTPSFTDKLNTLASGILICSIVSIHSFGGIPSTPVDVLSFIAFIFLATISGVTTALNNLI